MKDILEKELKVGNFIFYATTSGRSPVLKPGFITKNVSEKRIQVIAENNYSFAYLDRSYRIIKVDIDDIIKLKRFDNLIEKYIDFFKVPKE